MGLKLHLMHIFRLLKKYNEEIYRMSVFSMPPSSFANRVQLHGHLYWIARFPCFFLLLEKGSFFKIHYIYSKNWQKLKPFKIYCRKWF